MKRVWLAALLLATLLGGCQRTTKTTTVRVVVSGAGRMPRARAFARRLADYHVPGMKLEICDAAGDLSRLERCAAGEPDLFVTVGGVETKAVMEAGGRAPVLYVGLAASLDWGYVRSLSRPGGRASGVDNNYAELTGKRLELLQMALPGVKRVLVLYQPQVVPDRRGLEEARRAAAKLHLQLSYYAASNERDIAGLAARLRRGGEDAVLLLPSFVLENHLAQVTAQVRAAGVPLVGLDSSQAAAGAFLAFGADGVDMGEQAARMARQLLLGYPISEMPVERPLVTKLSLNLRTARELGLEPDPRLLDLAQVVVR